MRHRARRRINSEVNLTPLIDIMTSLLAIFMLTAPMMTSGISLSLPKGDGSAMSQKQDILDISINENGAFFLGKNEVSAGLLIPKVKALYKENPSIQIMISGDEAAPYGKIIELMSLLKVNGFEQVGLKTDLIPISEGMFIQKHTRK